MTELLLQMVPVPLGLLCLCTAAAAGGSLRSAVCLYVCFGHLLLGGHYVTQRSVLSSFSHVSSPHHHLHHHRQHSPKCPSSFSSSSSSIQSKTVSVWPCLALICALKRLRRRGIMMPVLLVLLVPLIRSTCLLSRLHCFKTGQSVWERGIRCPFDACFGIDSSMNHHRRCHYHHHHHHHHYT